MDDYNAVNSECMDEMNNDGSMHGCKQVWMKAEATEHLLFRLGAASRATSTFDRPINVTKIKLVRKLTSVLIIVQPKIRRRRLDPLRRHRPIRQMRFLVQQCFD